VLTGLLNNQHYRGARVLRNYQKRPSNTGITMPRLPTPIPRVRPRNGPTSI
jgi:hypothetical protein